MHTLRLNGGYILYFSGNFKLFNSITSVCQLQEGMTCLILLVMLSEGYLGYLVLGNKGNQVLSVTRINYRQQ